MVGPSRICLWLLAGAMMMSAGVIGAEVEPEATPKTILLVRHAEKCHGTERDPLLSEAGYRRALALARTLHDVPIDAIYSTPFHRTVDTVAPIAAQHEIEITRTPVEKGFLEDLVLRLRESGLQTHLVSGHSNTIPEMVNLLAGTDYEDLSEFDYDKLFVVTLTSEGTASVLVLRYGEPSSKQPGC